MVFEFWQNRPGSTPTDPQVDALARGGILS
jgi:hypothetical protein